MGVEFVPLALELWPFLRREGSESLACNVGRGMVVYCPVQDLGGQA